MIEAIAYVGEDATNNVILHRLYDEYRLNREQVLNLVEYYIQSEGLNKNFDIDVKVRFTNTPLNLSINESIFSKNNISLKGK